MPRLELVELSHESLVDDDGEGHRFALAVPRGLPVLAVHFPGSPVLPAYLEISEVLVRIRRVWPALGPWRGAPALKFQAPIRPGARLELWLHRAGSSDRVSFTITAGDAASAMPYASGALDFGSLPEYPA